MYAMNSDNITVHEISLNETATNISDGEFPQLQHENEMTETKGSEITYIDCHQSFKFQAKSLETVEYM